MPFGIAGVSVEVEFEEVSGEETTTTATSVVLEAWFGVAVVLVELLSAYAPGITVGVYVGIDDPCGLESTTGSELGFDTIALIGAAVSVVVLSCGSIVGSDSA